MYEYHLTIGLFDRDTCTQIITGEEAESIIAECLLNRFDIYAYTMIPCRGCYRMNDGRIVHEPSIRVEIASDCDISDTIRAAIRYLKIALNQESIMLKTMQSAITFE